MKIFTTFRRSIALLFLLAAPGLVHAQGTAFTYQGRLINSGSPATGNYDFTFALFNNNSTNSGQINSTLTNLNLGVTNGIFTTTLDFSNAFDGTPRWLSIGVRTNGVGAFTPLAPLQPVTPSPYAITAATAIFANSALTATTASNVTGLTIQSNTNLLVAGNVTGNSFIGNGSNLTSVNASLLNGQAASTFAPATGSSNYVSKAGDTITGSLSVSNNLLVAGSVTGGSFIGNGTNLTNVNASLLNGQAASAFARATGSSNYVSKAGDTITGSLNVSNNLLVAGSVTANSFIGNGTNLTNVNASLLNGQAASAFASAASLSTIVSKAGDSITGSLNISNNLLVAGSVTGGSFIGNGSSVSNVNASLLNGQTAGAFAPATGSSNYVSKAGDTITGSLSVNGVTTTVGGLIIENRSSDPASPPAGRIWLRTDL